MNMMVLQTIVHINAIISTYLSIRRDSLYHTVHLQILKMKMRKKFLENVNTWPEFNEYNTKKRCV